MEKLHKIGLAIIRENKLLLVRDTNGLLLFPGGTIEGNETYEECLQREVKEELGVVLKKETLKYIGKYSDRAAGKKDTVVEFDFYVGDFEGELKPQGEIVELHWFDKRTDWRLIDDNPIAKHKLIPALIQKNFL